MSIVDPELVELRLAATVMIVRDGSRGLEVFMVRRNPASVFVGGAYVFPGGAVDDHDRLDDDIDDVTSGLTDVEASARLGVPAGGLAHWVAAIRECFEEAGLLLAYDDAGRLVRLDDPAVAERFSIHRADVDAGRRRLVEVCEDERLTLACDGIHYFSHWITPVGSPRRYDTRFFVARAPEAQIGAHDDREIVANLWVRPEEALERREAGELSMIQPTVRNLEAICRFGDVDGLMSVAAAQASVSASGSNLFREDGGMRIMLPGDPGYDAAGLAVPGGGE